MNKFNYTLVNSPDYTPLKVTGNAPDFNFSVEVADDEECQVFAVKSILRYSTPLSEALALTAEYIYEVPYEQGIINLDYITK